MATVAGALLPKRNEAPEVHVHPNHDHNVNQQTLQWMGTKHVEVVDSPKPLVTDDNDALVKITSSCICGSDLHLYLGAMPGTIAAFILVIFFHLSMPNNFTIFSILHRTGMKKHDIMGHEVMGIVESVGPSVRTLSVGDRVVVAFDIACGSCVYCKNGHFSGCDNTNPSKEQEMLYGHHTAGIFGYSQLTGGYEGGQAEFARVPLADVNCLKLPSESELPDDKVVLLSDVLSTAWHANELGRVAKGDSVAIWGAGPVGILAAHCAQVRGASRVVLIDQEDYRLQFAKEKLPGVETINFKTRKTLDQLHELFVDEDKRYIGPDVVIEAVGFHYVNSFSHWFQMALKLETDPSEILNELIYAVRKGGRIAVVGVYAGVTNGFNIGAFMEKGLTMAAGQTPVQKYWKHLLGLIQDGTLHPEMIITHHVPLKNASEAYKMFNEKEDGCIKVVLKP